MLACWHLCINQLWDRGRTKQQEEGGGLEVWPRLSPPTHLWPRRGWCGAPCHACSWRCSGNLPRPMPPRSRCAGSSGSTGRTCAGPGDRRSVWSRRLLGWAWFQRGRERERWRHSSRCRWALEAFSTVVMADSLTYSPSAIHSISSTWPLSTVWELEEPDGMRKVGFLSSTGSSVVRDWHRNVLLSLLHLSITQWLCLNGHQTFQDSISTVISGYVLLSFHFRSFIL